MANGPPRRVAQRSSMSRASYYQEGRRHVDRALALHPGAAPLDALMLMVEAPPASLDPTLRPATARRYREDLTVIVSVLARAARRRGKILDTGSAMARIEAALMLRRGRPEVARGASLRVKNATEEEARNTFVRLKAIALRDRAMTAAAAALYVLVESRIGVRPIELCGALVEGTILSIPNAKRGDGQAERRLLDLQHLQDTLIEAVRLLAWLAPPAGDPHAFERWRNGLASCLARASLSAGGRRLALYSFRHVAIATWEKAGLSAQEIARLAGHLSARTAKAHYARAGSGWALDGLPQPVADPDPAAIRGSEELPAGETELADLPATNAEAFAMPTPVVVPSSNASPPATESNPNEIGAWFERHQARIDDLGRRVVQISSREVKRDPEAELPEPGRTFRR